ncbi:hypothetical protein GEV33_004040 [Tenebrio molitor]|uniref:Uncharacterized protein n=1 Tax=Tenebrio molitor TaxID=7067 RepID=A0A8J6LN44_TENMO|nr:hypothetical protein GEV33_004040 [Tenebrio molitor]
MTSLTSRLLRGDPKNPSSTRTTTTTNNNNNDDDDDDNNGNNSLRARLASARGRDHKVGVTGARPRPPVKLTMKLRISAAPALALTAQRAVPKRRLRDVFGLVTRDDILKNRQRARTAREERRRETPALTT